MYYTTYKFSYGGVIKKYLSKFIMLLHNSIVSLILFFIYISIISNINYFIKDQCSLSIYDTIHDIEILFGLLIPVFLSVLAFIPQKAIVTKSTIYVYRYCLFFRGGSLFKGLNDTIQIKNITIVEKAPKKMWHLNLFLLELLIGTIWYI